MQKKEDVPPWGGAHPLGRRGDSKCPCTPPGHRNRDSLCGRQGGRGDRG